MIIRVYGDPKPQGSKNASVINGRAYLYESSKYLPAWRETCIMAIKATMLETNCKQFLGPVAVTMTFFMKPAKSNKRLYPNMAPDTDKLCRSVGDCLEISGLLSNDAQIVTLIAYKIFATDKEQPGVEIEVVALHD
jgi:Holliday junction resolvase RusA-like endonuclease